MQASAYQVCGGRTLKTNVITSLSRNHDVPKLPPEDGSNSTITSGSVDYGVIIDRNNFIDERLGIWLR